MATYKVIQDIEAEDKILGPLTLRQFIYGLIAGFLLYICFLCVIKGAPYLLVIFLPPALFTAFFAAPFGRDQPTEVWALAKIRFYFKPRRRVWNQSGVKELVTITVPKKVEQFLTNGLSQNEVESRLKALANTIDSRGWAIKNVNVNMFSQPDPLSVTTSDRLIDINSLPQEVPNYDVRAADDMLDETNNPIAHQFEAMINTSTQSHRQHIMDELNGVRQEAKATTAPAPNDYWFLNQPAEPPKLPADQAVFDSTQVVHPGSDDDDSVVPTAAEAELINKLKATHDSQQVFHSHLRTIQPLGSQPTVQPAATDDTPPPQAVTAPPDPAILSLANNNDLNVATLAREASKAKNPEPPDDEVVISLR